MTTVSHAISVDKRRLRARYGQWAAVTGASDGIGRAFATELARCGLNLVLVARRAEVLQALASELSAKYCVQCVVIAVDLATDAGNALLAEKTSALDVGVLVVSAGFGTSGEFVSSDLADEEAMLSINCLALLRTTWCFAGRFRDRKRGGIVLLSSIVAFQGVPHSAHYAATKAYVQTLAEGLHAELKSSRVDVLSVAPGPVSSGFAARANLKLGNAMSPDVIAKQSLDALGRVGTARPGWLSKVLGYSLAMTPRWGRVKIMGAVMRGMTAHQNKS
jgi:uncharacterized protein